MVKAPSGGATFWSRAEGEHKDSDYFLRSLDEITMGPYIYMYLIEACPSGRSYEDKLIYINFLLLL